MSRQVSNVHTTWYDGEWKPTRNSCFYDGIGGFIGVQPNHNRGASVTQQSIRALTRGLEERKNSSIPSHSEYFNFFKKRIVIRVLWCMPGQALLYDERIVSL